MSAYWKWMRHRAAINRSADAREWRLMRPLIRLSRGSFFETSICKQSRVRTWGRKQSVMGIENKSKPTRMNKKEKFCLSNAHRTSNLSAIDNVNMEMELRERSECKNSPATKVQSAHFVCKSFRNSEKQKCNWPYKPASQSHIGLHPTLGAPGYE